MCDSYRDDPNVSHDTNVILRTLHCQENRRQLGHCVTRGPNGRWNVPVSSQIQGVKDAIQENDRREV